MRGWWQDLTDLVLPAECGGCGRPRTVLCRTCRAALGGEAPRRVRPVPEPPGLPVVYAASAYADEVRAVLLAHKERGALALTGPLGAALAGAVRAGLADSGADDVPGAGTFAGRMCGDAGGGGGRPADRAPPGAPCGVLGGSGGSRPVLLVPVPSARRAVRARGHDPVRRIALAAAGELRRTGTPARVAAVLRQRRAVADQSGLGSRQRSDNLAGALAVVPGAVRLLREGGPVVLVDDLVTTGASLAEAARAVRVAPGAVTERGAGARPYRTARTVVYPGAVWEGREERRTGATEARADGAPAGPGTTGGAESGGALRGAIRVMRAAVVAASPDSFEINRN